MANAQQLLNAAKKQKTSGAANQAAPKRQTATGQRMMENVLAASSDLNSLENIYFNPADDNVSLDEAYETYPNGQRHKIYDAEEEMKQLSSGQFDINNETASKMPKAILESIIRNPLNMPTDGVAYSGNDVNEMMNGLQNRTIDILDKLEARDKKGKIMQQAPSVYTQQPQPMDENLDYSFGSDVDYNKIAQIVEAVVDNKLKQYGNALLTESRKTTQNNPQVSFIKLGDTFTFMDDSNNVYECKMVYKGKGKIKSR